jgi:hypothetical protein
MGRKMILSIKILCALTQLFSNVFFIKMVLVCGMLNLLGWFLVYYTMSPIPLDFQVVGMVLCHNGIKSYMLSLTFHM